MDAFSYTVSGSSTEKLKGPTEGLTLTLVNDKAGLDALIGILKAADIIAFDVETTTANVHGKIFKLIGMSFAVNSAEGYYIPTGHIESDQPTWMDSTLQQLDKEYVLDKLSFVWNDKKLIAHNMKFEYQVMRKLGRNIKHPYFCTMIAQYIIDNRTKKLGLKPLTKDILKRKALELRNVTTDGGINLEGTPIEATLEYAAPDAVNCFELYEYQLVKLKKDYELYNLFFNIEMPVMTVIAKMELLGMLLDEEKIVKLNETLANECKELEHDMMDILESAFGHVSVGLVHDDIRFNPASNAHVTTILYSDTKFNLPRQSSSKSDKKALLYLRSNKQLMDKNPIANKFIGLILKYREIDKLRGTYTTNLLEKVSEIDGRLHPEFRQTVTNSGRLTSNNPNAQNIPTRNDGYNIRANFVANKKGMAGRCFTSADYHAQEMRVTAAISSDKTLAGIILGHMKVSELGDYNGTESALLDDNGKNIILYKDTPVDIHCYTATKILGIPYHKITKETRKRIKPVAFGILYGIGPPGLADQIDASIDVAREYINKWLDTFPGVKDFINRCKYDIMHNRCIRTRFGRKRMVPAPLMKEDFNGLTKAGVFRELINTAIQGTSADITKIAMVRVAYSLRKAKLDATIIMQIHDEIVVENNVEDSEKVARILMRGMYLELPSSDKSFVVPIISEPVARMSLSKSDTNILSNIKLPTQEEVRNEAIKEYGSV